MNNYWVGVIVGAGLSSGFFTILMLININQNTEMKNQIRSEIQDVRELVGEHEKIMRAYEFYNWKMSFSDEVEK
ncbi:MAG: hypothetical protein IIZ78_23140 [Clostridiales bacterium]|nr:hypothetical protein [Clostridiales bacterium]